MSRTTAVPALVHGEPQRIHELMLATAHTDPDRPAVLEPGTDGGIRFLTYGELESRAHDYAVALDRAGVGVGDRVILESDNSACAVAMVLACSLLGAAFVPVGPEVPAARLLSVVAAAQPVLHLQTEQGRRDGVPAPVGTARFGPAGVTVERHPGPRVRLRRTPVTTDAAYMIFTSGTTGRPKGVVMSHRGVLAFYRGMLRQGIVGPQDRVATASPLQFDFSLLDIGLTLGSGAALVPIPRDLLPWPRRLLRFLADTGATQVNGVPSIWRPVLRHEPEGLATLAGQVRGVLFSGEAFPLPEMRRLQELLPGVRVVNCFGPTETMAFSLTEVPNPLPAGRNRLSIGQAYDGAEILLVDKKGAPVEAPGVVGEIHLRGPSLFTGYWDDPEGTRAVLVPDPLDPRSGQVVYKSGDLAEWGEDGGLYFVGRADLQVKIRGNRVELGEIERRLLEHPDVVAAAAVVLPREGGDDPLLTAFAVPAPGAGPVDETALSAFCKQTLPAYMIPRRVRLIEALPLTPNGKTDRRALVAGLTAPQG
ncbi:amino acid adenylation domain-containing protein [Streptomyces meridianus]|uniref:Amino acid adenylation domain-containing protein n=1 Tax=Streptomyces meridianus TaxID=2938945 RepID=A0ABT0XAP4_9ACTN|nr:amino acid adenylation domain-containing protein [Streptomyces meridianus]MCM2579596.1 amino acid adenylation domain-containing protein [Streptomyces meridianus]